MRLVVLSAVLAAAAGCCYEHEYRAACVANGACFTITRSELVCLYDFVEDELGDDLLVDARTCPGTAYEDRSCADLGIREER